MSGTDTVTDTKIEIKLPSLWKVVLLNDDFTPMPFVVQILIQIYNKSFEEAQALMLAVHDHGKANVGLYTKDIAQTKVSVTVKTAEIYGHPLMAVAEEA